MSKIEVGQLYEVITDVFLTSGKHEQLGRSVPIKRGRSFS